MNGNDLEGQGMTFDPVQGQISDSLSSPTEHTDSKYEFDPMSLTGSSSAPLSPPGSSSALSGSLSAPLSPPSDMVDFDGVAKHVHEASTASVSPQSPGNTTGDIFSLNQNEADPMTSSLVGNPLGDPMTSSFIGDEKTVDLLAANVSSSHDEEINLQNCDKMPADGSANADIPNDRGFMDQIGASEDAHQIALGEDMPDGFALPPPGGPVTMASLQEIGVYGAPPPEEGDDLVCLDDGLKMPSTQAPQPPLIPSTGTLIDTQAPMGNDANNPFGAPAEMNGAPLGNLLDDIPGQPPIAAAPPPVQPREAFVEQAPLIPSLASAPGGPAQAQAEAAPAFPAGPPKPPRSGGEALLLEDLMPSEGGDGLPPVIPPLNLSGMAQPMEPMGATPAPAAPEPATPPVKSPPPQKATAVNGSQITPPSKSPTKKDAPQDSSKIPSPKRAKPATAVTSPPGNNKIAAATKTAAAPAAADKTAPARKVSPTAGKPAAGGKSGPPKSASPRASSGTAQSPRGQTTNSASPRGPASAKSPRATNSASPRASTARSHRTPKGYYHM